MEIRRAGLFWQATRCGEQRMALDVAACP